MPTTFANLNQRYKRLDGSISQQIGGRNLLQGGYKWVQDNYRGANRVVGDNDGRRITSHSMFGTWAVPKVGLVVRLSDRWTARGAFGKASARPISGRFTTAS